MQAFSFYLALPFISFFSRLPLGLLYFLSDYFFYPLVRFVVGYRKDVIRHNLLQAFPNKTPKEREEIEKQYYHYFCDLFLETLKSFSANSVFLNKHISVINKEVFDKIFEESNGVVLTVGHVGNYEWLGKSLPLLFGVSIGGPYRKFTNPYFDEFFKKSREKCGAILFHTNKTLFFLKRSKEKVAIALANDQWAPSESSYWTRFLNQDTTFYGGTEKIARQMGFGVVFLHITVVKRGYYEITLKPITGKPANEPVGQIMEMHAKLLEQNILEAPQYWLWSHRRWKKEKPDSRDYGFPHDVKS